MPTIEYRCQACAHEFKRVVFRGDDSDRAVCPACGQFSGKPEPTVRGVFDGISGFSRLAKDTN